MVVLVKLSLVLMAGQISAVAGFILVLKLQNLPQTSPGALQPVVMVITGQSHPRRILLSVDATPTKSTTSIIAVVTVGISTSLHPRAREDGFSSRLISGRARLAPRIWFDSKWLDKCIENYLLAGL
mgnify:CR=1 FL=1